MSIMWIVEYLGRLKRLHRMGTPKDLSRSRIVFYTSMNKTKQLFLGKMNMTIKATIKELRAELAAAVATHKATEGQKSPYDSVEIRALHLMLAFAKGKPFALFNGEQYSKGAPEYRRDKSDFFQAKAILHAKIKLGLYDEVERYGRKTKEIKKNTPFDSWVNGEIQRDTQSEAA